jgi:hypothetical protein
VGEIILDKMKALPEKMSFAIGLSLIVGSGVLLFLLSLLFPIGNKSSVFLYGNHTTFYMFSGRYV